MIIMRSRFLLLLVIVFAIVAVDLPFMVNASSPEDVSVNMTPENPAPGENVNIALNSYAYNLDSVLISWSLNGKKTSSGIGKKLFSLNAPAAGSATTVTATLGFPDGDVEKEMIVRSSVMVLLWQADDSYVPPFYKGKALPTPDSEVKVVAMPEIKAGSQMVNPKNMVYAWQQDYNNVQDSSGYGKNYFIYTNDYLDNLNNIAVTASTVDQSYSSEANINIGTTDPKIEFYKNDTGLGTLWEQALIDGHLVKGDETIQAVPYFISPKDTRIPLLTWDWSINDSPIEVSIASKNLLPIKAQAGVSGTAKINLEINNSEKIFETASKTITVQF